MFGSDAPSTRAPQPFDESDVKFMLSCIAAAMNSTVPDAVLVSKVFCVEHVCMCIFLSFFSFDEPNSSALVNKTVSKLIFYRFFWTMPVRSIEYNHVYTYRVVNLRNITVVTNLTSKNI